MAQSYAMIVLTVLVCGSINGAYSQWVPNFSQWSPMKATNQEVLSLLPIAEDDHHEVMFPRVSILDLDRVIDASSFMLTSSVSSKSSAFPVDVTAPPSSSSVRQMEKFPPPRPVSFWNIPTSPADVSSIGQFVLATILVSLITINKTPKFVLDNGHSLS